MSRSRESRHCLVTGAAGSAGRELARRLTDEGYVLTVVDVSEGVRDVAEAVSARAMVTDLGSYEACATLAADLGERGVDVLVNNAARVATVAFTHELDAARWEADIATNLSAPFYLSSLFLPGMVTRGWGRIVNIGSIAADGLYRQAGYAPSKAGLVGLTKTVALEYADSGVTCNVVAPGLIASRAVGEMPDDIYGDAVAQIPTGRPGRLEDIAAAVVFLASDDAAYVNGAVLHVDGGAHANQLRVTRRGSKRFSTD